MHPPLAAPANFPTISAMGKPLSIAFAVPSAAKALSYNWRLVADHAGRSLNLCIPVQRPMRAGALLWVQGTGTNSCLEQCSKCSSEALQPASYQPLTAASAETNLSMLPVVSPAMLIRPEPAI